MTATIDKIPSLRELALFYIARRIDKMPETCFTGYENDIDYEELRYVHFQGNKFNSFVNRTPINLETPKTVDLTHFDHCTDSTIETISNRYQSSLSCLRVQAHALTDEAIICLVQHCPNITKLHLYHGLFTSISAKLLSQFYASNLEEFSLVGAHSIRGGGTSIRYTLFGGKTATKQTEITTKSLQMKSPIGLLMKSLNPSKLRFLDISYSHLTHKDLQMFSNTILNSSSILTTLKMASCSLGDGGVLALSSGLQNNTSITELDLSGNLISELGLRILLQALGGLDCNLTSLPEPTEEASSLLESSEPETNGSDPTSLESDQEFNFSQEPDVVVEVDSEDVSEGDTSLPDPEDPQSDANKNVSDGTEKNKTVEQDAGNVVNESDVEIIPRRAVCSVEHANGFFQGTAATDNGNSSLPRKSTLLKLNLSNNRCSDSSSVIFGSFLNLVPNSLIELDLSGNDFGSEVFHFAAGVAKSHIQTLNLSDNSLRRGGALSFFDGLSSISEFNTDISLNNLDLSMNLFLSFGAECVAKYIQNNPKPHNIILHLNEFTRSGPSAKLLQKSRKTHSVNVTWTKLSQRPW